MAAGASDRGPNLTNEMIRLRRATAYDLDFLIRIDLEDEGYPPAGDEKPIDLAQHRTKIEEFVRDPDKAA